MATSKLLMELQPHQIIIVQVFCQQGEPLLQYNFSKYFLINKGIV